MDHPKIEEWYRQRGYPHFDWPRSRAETVDLVTDAAAVASHSFMPLISFEMREPRYHASRKCVEQKIRPIACASHADSHIYSYYAAMLKLPVEQRIAELGLNDAVLAYRRMPGGKCNIHFADEAFNDIRRRGSCSAIAVDVEKFFDTLDHSQLKQAWCELLQVDRLPPDHYAVFRSLTRYSKVDRATLYEQFGVGRRQQDKLRRPVCTPKEFRERVRGNGLIKTNRKPFGIPQGTPISALLSNLYMLATDKFIQEYAALQNASYRRYSDDILLISDTAHAAEFEAQVVSQVKDVGLSINSSKTNRSCFSKGITGTQDVDKPLAYLGFEFDGKSKRIRPKTLARYHQRASRAVRSAQRAAKTAGSPRLKRRELYERYTHLGRRNFVRYAMRAAKLMQDPMPRKQVRRHWDKLDHRISLAEADLA